MTVEQHARPEITLDVTQLSISTSRREIPDDATADEISKLVMIDKRQTKIDTAETTALTVFSPTTSGSKSHQHANGALLNELVFERHRRSCFHLLMQCPLYLLGFCLLCGASWAFFGADALPPEGNVFSILVLFVSAVVGGWIMQSIKLPSLLGQLIAGIVVRNLPFINITNDNDSIRWSPQIRMLALTVILLRGGLGLDPEALKKLKGSVLLLSTVPVFVESSCYAVLTHYLMQFPWEWGFLLGFVLSAVSPAVIVPSMLRLQQTGLGVEKGIPTLIMAAASFDDVVAIAGVGVTLSMIFNNASDLMMQVFQGPLEIVSGIMCGLLIGWLLWYIPNPTDNSVLKFRAILLCGCGVFCVFGAQQLGHTGAGALGCLTTAFVAAYGWKQREQQPTSKSQQEVESSVTFTESVLASMWSVVFQPLLFALIGAEIAFAHLTLSSFGIGLVVFCLALIMRLFASVAAVSFFGSRLEWKERAFVALAWIPKATVQAAVGPLAYDMARQFGRGERELALGMDVLTFAVLVILITAPLGAVVINLSCDKLLKKSDVPANADSLFNKSDEEVPTGINDETGVPINVIEMGRANDMQLDVMDTDVKAFNMQLDVIDTDVEAFADFNGK